MHLGNNKHQSGDDARLWYSLYVLDKLSSCASGRPSSIKESDCTVPETLVLSNRPDELTLPDMSAFLDLIRLCRIIAEVQSTLFSPGMASLTAVEALARIGHCDELLLSWASKLNLELRSEGETPPRGPLFLWAVHLHIAYHQTCVTNFIADGLD